MRSSVPTWSAAATTPSRSGSSGQRFGFRTVNDPHGSGATTLNGINDAGDLVGFYTDAKGNTDGLLVARGQFPGAARPAGDQHPGHHADHDPHGQADLDHHAGPRADRGGTDPLLTLT